ncbi:hypothetical protein [Staphylococcus chromogenes]|uniref:hypothetical protein n=1 Tax=Staphylococcus chromogenes TaxID=46126 RepID=UPI001E40742A|nr:hypothetical protein [Staphylococcus chromogenes]MCD9062711.1 hypothetical protein [Staphylococcus chromogenes]MDU0430678.1 hypothetical protein [Staphylococcus chromogenes]
MNPIVKLEDELIKSKLSEGKQGLAFLLEYANPYDDDRYDLLLKQAGVKYDFYDDGELEEFIKDSFSKGPNEFYDKYGVNFWISRDANLTTLSKSVQNMNDSNKDYMIGLYAERFLSNT